jgi:adenylate cyclase
VSAGLSTAEAARRVGVSPGTLSRWVKAGVVPQGPDGWDDAALGQARLVARLRSRGHSLRDIEQATGEGRLAFGSMEHLLQEPDGDFSLEDAARETGLDPALIERLHTAMGFNATSMERMTEDDVQLLHYTAAVLAAGLPLVALLQLARVYGQALAQIADAEVRLFHLYVHEPLMRDGVPGVEMAEEMRGLSAELLPLASPIMEHVHRRFMAHFVEQDVIGHMETDPGQAALDLGRMRVAIAFADLAGYTRLTEEVGEEEAVGAVERFVEVVELTLPEDARVIKTIGDEVMIVGSDPSSLVDWAVGFQQLSTERPFPRLGVHWGETIYRDGDYYGRAVNQAHRVAARAAGSEVIVTRPVVEASGPHLEFERIGEVSLKGFSEPTELFLARPGDEG